MAYKIKKFKNKNKARDRESYFIGYTDGVDDYYHSLQESKKRIKK